jgi:hypothetical protein
VEDGQYATLPLDGAGAIAEAVRTGAIQLLTSGGDGDGAARPVACVPLCAGGDVVGVLVLFSLLPHKAGFEPVDLALFDLLLEEGAVALSATETR